MSLRTWDFKPEPQVKVTTDVDTCHMFTLNNRKEDICAGEVDPRTAAKVQESWVNFARTGDPSVKGVRWKKYNTKTRDTMVIEKDKWKCVSDPSKKARELLKKAYGDEPYYVW